MGALANFAIILAIIAGFWLGFNEGYKRAGKDWFDGFEAGASAIESVCEKESAAVLL